MKGGISVKNWENDFAYYEGDRFVMIGNIKQISYKTGIDEKKIKYYSTNAYQRRHPNGKAIIEISGEDS